MYIFAHKRIKKRKIFISIDYCAIEKQFALQIAKPIEACDEINLEFSLFRFLSIFRCRRGLKAARALVCVKAGRFKAPQASLGRLMIESCCFEFISILFIHSATNDCANRAGEFLSRAAEASIDSIKLQ